MTHYLFIAFLLFWNKIYMKLANFKTFLMQFLGLVLCLKQISTQKCFLTETAKYCQIVFQSNCSIHKLLLYESTCFSIIFTYVLLTKLVPFLGNWQVNNTYYFKFYFIKLWNMLKNISNLSHFCCYAPHFFFAQFRSTFVPFIIDF